ncbi:hypothetical protein [Priestia endophytica]|uniref:hypothetical protein n=1 Tax=Priestia endophytica TaxID=135735 RepID=UPI0022817880|nr:hypothetical protein [Priestia endophytica]MCY8234159.1 hypothetical protein [Priestia endophytica]
MSIIEINPDSVKKLAKKVASIGDDISAVDQRVNTYLQELKGVSLSISFNSIDQSINSLHSIASETASKMEIEDNIFSSLLKLPSLASDYLSIKGNLDKVLISTQSLVALSLLATKSININMRNAGTGVVSISTAKWVKGQGTPSVFRNFARRVNKFIKTEHTNPVLKVLKNKTGLSNYRTFNGWLKYNFMGIGDNYTKANIKKVTGSIAKKVFPISVASNVIEEGIGGIDKYSKGKLTPTDIAVSASNVAIKSAAAYSGSVIGASLFGLAGPPGAVAGAFIGGAAGTFVGDIVASKAQKFIEKHSDTINKTAHKVQDGISKAKKEVSDVIDKGKKEVSKTIDKGKELFSQGSKWVSGLLH